mgnify:CR=1 FL=1
MFALQLFPEASIDYWLRNIELVDHENLVVEAAQGFSTAGFLVLVKDHPLQFGFRKTDFLDRLAAIKNVVILPYDVSGNELMSLAGASFSSTGTLGFKGFDRANPSRSVVELGQALGRQLTLLANEGVI